MLKIVIVEQEEYAKEIVFLMRKILEDEFTFTYYDKITSLIKDEKNGYDVLILNETYNNERISRALNYNKNESIFIYVCSQNHMHKNSIYGRIFNIDIHNLEQNLFEIKPLLNSRLMRHSDYLFSYNGVTLKLKYHDIYYIEKQDKNLVYHTRKGEFYERGSINKKAIEFEPFDFVRINSGILVNYEYIFKIENDEVEVHNHKRLPISRSKKAKLLEFIRDKTNPSR